MSFRAKVLENMMIIPAIATFYLFETKVVSVRSTTGKSMLPTIQENSILVVDRCFYKLFGNQIKKGDIVVAGQPVDPQTHICKRVVAVGGDKLPQYSGITVPENTFWLQGDNKSASYDSRQHGVVPLHQIEGKVLYMFPL